MTWLRFLLHVHLELVEQPGLLAIWSDVAPVLPGAMGAVTASGKRAKR